VLEFLPALLRGTVVTVQITVAASLVAIAIGLVMGLARLSPWWPIRALAVGYIELFRGTSLLVQLFWWFFVLPHFGIFLPAMLVGILGIGMNVGAYGAEVVRGAILSVPRGQYEAAIALNMSPLVRMRRIILPQAVLAMLPPWGNLLIELLKGTALVSLITIHDLTFIAHAENMRTFQTVEIFTLVLVLYYLLGRGLITPGVRLLERRFSRGLMQRRSA
jgi:polar amino acid transport system permease protein